jgi:hypothetical protein
MPRKPASKPAPATSQLPPFATTPDTEWAGYVNYTLSEQQLKEYKDWEMEIETFYDQLVTDVVASGVQFSLKYQPDQQAFTVSMTSKPRPDMDCRIVMTTWGNSPLDALRMAIYKWTAVLQCDTSDYLPKSQTFRRFG